jgi:photosystem II stability/assembly factor-like uncharacterized protein
MATTRVYVGMHDGVTTLSSIDGGASWQQGPVSPLEHAAAKVAASASSPERAYIAAYEAGVHRTNDGGVTWKQLAAYPTNHAHSLAIHPTNPDIVYVGSEPASVYRTNDGGSTWEECTAFREVPGADEWSFHWEGRHAHVRDLRLSPDNPEVIYAGIEVGGILRSSDGGKSWEHLHGANTDVHKVIASPSKPSTVYAATARGPFRSDDNGDTWTDIGTELERRHNIPIIQAPDDHNLVIAGVASSARRQEAEIVRSKNGGRNWSKLEGLGADDNMVVSLAWDPADTNRVFAGTDKGTIHMSTDRGASWSLICDSIATVAVGAIAVSSVQ